VHGIEPRHGPIDGGTLVTLLGDKLDTGADQSVQFAGRLCNLSRYVQYTDYFNSPLLHSFSGLYWSNNSGIYCRLRVMEIATAMVTARTMRHNNHFITSHSVGFLDSTKEGSGRQKSPVGSRGEAPVGGLGTNPVGVWGTSSPGS